MSNTEVMKESKRDNLKVIKPKFRKDSELTFEQRTDPDYRLKQIETLNGDKLSITCSKCHHCR